MIQGRFAAVAVCLAAGAGGVGVAEAVPVMVQSAPGRFEVAAVDPSAAHAVATLAGECWRHLEGPLALPTSFSSPVFVRLLRAANEPEGSVPYRVNVEAGGVVSVWIWNGSDALVRRALVRGLLARLAVALHGVGVVPTVPLWLETACVGWWETRADGAALDALKQRSTGWVPPQIARLLDWAPDEDVAAEYGGASVWLLAFLRAESGRGGEWGTMLRRLLAGADPQATLAVAYPGRFHGLPARELWWQTGWHHVRRLRSLPALEAAESRILLASLSRFVMAAPDGETDRVVPLREVLAHGAEFLLQAEVARRAAELGRAISSLHPFYRNAGLSLAEVLGPAGREAGRIEARCAAFEQDSHDAMELEAAANAALDALERRSVPPGAPGAG